MPQASSDLRRKWRCDHVAIAFLQAAGYNLTPQFEWIAPSATVSPDEASALEYLFAEWDFGGVIAIKGTLCSPGE